MQDLNRLVGRYEIVGQLGEGGMATVYLARQPDLNRLVALKELRTVGNGDPAFAKRFLREARMASSLSHPNIVTVYDYFEADGIPFIAMEYMERGSLRPYIGQMSLAQVGNVLESLLAGLEYAGSRGIVHRDLKPENVMVSAEGRVGITDFGIAKARNAFQTGGALTAEGTALGTPNYMAPEQALAEDVGTWTDIYAVGVIAFEIFVGRPPFADTPQPLVVIMRQVQDPIPLVTDIDPTIDPRIAEWIAWLTAKEPAARPQSAAQAWDAFEDIITSILGPRWQRGSRLPALGAAAAIAPPGPATPPPFAAAAGPLSQQTIGIGSDAPTRPLDPGIEPTVMPNPNILGIDRTMASAGEKANGPRRGKRLMLGLVAAGVLAAAAFAAAAGGGGSSNNAARSTQAAKIPKAAAAPQAATQPAAAPVATNPGTQSASPAAPSGTLASKGRDAKRLADQYTAGAKQIEGLSATGAQHDNNVLIAGLMRQTGTAYSTAATAAARGDNAGYSAAIAAAQAAKAQVDQAAKSTPTSSGGGGGGGGAAKPSACAGDSTSDDPSDDSCGGEP